MKEPEDSQQRLPLGDLPPLPEVQPPRERRIWCNRNLRLDQITLVGFDMDYTLAVYDQEAIDRLSVRETAKKLVALGYPRALDGMRYHTAFPIRGLLVDKKLGNVIKTDRYRYAKKAYHGTREVPSEERKKLYQSRRVRAGTRRYHAVDTLYELSEVAVFAAAIDILDRKDGKLDYAKLYEDIRNSIDEAHRDGSIKNVIAAEPDRFLTRDPELPATLHKLRSAGKKLFLLTNSEPEYTERAMQFLLEPGKPEYPSWRNYFDVVITEAQKPRFFEEARPFEEVEGGGGKILRGGSLAAFEERYGVRGDHVLYVGDHIYGDVLRAKKDSAWRTLMIIQEMTGELHALELYQEEVARLHDLEQRRDALHDALRDRQIALKQIQKQLDPYEAAAARAAEGGPPESEDDAHARVELEAQKLRLRRSIDRVRIQMKAVDEEYDELDRMIERATHPFWGSPFKAEGELSSFGEQVERFACLYTDRVTNLLHYSASHYFRGPRHRMAHE